MTDDLDASANRHPAASRERARLLDHLERINRAFARNHAIVDLTVDEAAGMSINRLRSAVANSEQRLADVIAATR